jgi:hypothetical protein
MSEDSGIADVVLRALSIASEPKTVRDVRKALTGPFRVSDDELSKLLAGLMDRGEVFEWPAKTAKGKVRYWIHDSTEYARRQVLDALNQGPQTQTELKRLLGKRWVLMAAALKEVVEVLKREGKVFEHPKLGKASAKLSTWPADPRPHLLKLLKEFQAVCAKLAPAGVSHEDISRALLELAGERLATVATRSPEAQVSPTSPDLAGRILTRMSEVEPRARTGALVSFRDVRRGMQVGKEAFDRAVVELANGGRIYLHQHSFPAGLSEAERKDLVDDGRGHFFIGAVLADVRS